MHSPVVGAVAKTLDYLGLEDEEDIVHSVKRSFNGIIGQPVKSPPIFCMDAKSPVFYAEGSELISPLSPSIPEEVEVSNN